MNADMVLIQEPPLRTATSTMNAHPAFELVQEGGGRTMTAISRAAKGKQIPITERTDVVKDCEGDAQAWDVRLSKGV